MSSFKLKLLAILTMLLDHIGVILFPNILWLRLIGRLAFPLFAFFITEGFRKTSDVKKYIQRLFILALVSQLPYWTAFGMDAGLNIFFTLTMGLLGLYLRDKYSTDFPVFLLAILAFIIDASYNVYGVLLIYVIHITRNNIKKMFGYFSLLHVIYYLVLLVLPYYNFKTFLMQFPALLTIILFKFYNGKLGYSAKNFFYLFYPVHLLVLVFIEKITK